MSERGIHFGILAGAVALAGWFFLRHGAPASQHLATPKRESPLAIVPPGSAFVLSADIAALRRSSLGALLATRINDLVGKNSDWSKLCDFDPLTALDQVALAVPSAGEGASEHDDDFGVIATGHFSAAQIARCATASIAARSGEPVASKIGNFSSIRDRKAEAGEIAARDDGTLILSGGAYFRTLLDAAEGNAPKLEHQDLRDARHAELRRLVGPGTIVSSWLLGEHWLERVAGDDAGLSPLKNLKALAARIEIAQTSHVVVLLECTDATSVVEIRDLLEKLRASLFAIPLDPRLANLARRIEVTTSERRLRLELDPSEPELRALLAATLPDAGSPPSSRSAPATSGVPRETRPR